MPPKTDSYHHGDLRQALLDAAVALVAEHGVHGLSLRECARRVGVSHAAPYRHFPDKEALLAAIAADGFARLADAGEQAIACLDQPLERLHAYGIAYVQFALDNPVHYRVMFTAMIEGEHLEIARTGDRAFMLLVGIATELGASAEPGRDPMVATIAAWSMVHGLAMLQLDGRLAGGLPDDEAAVRQFVDAVVRVLETGLRP